MTVYKLGDKVKVADVYNAKALDYNKDIFNNTSFGIVDSLSRGYLSIKVQWYDKRGNYYSTWWVNPDGIQPYYGESFDKFSHHKKRVEERHIKSASRK